MMNCKDFYQVFSIAVNNAIVSQKYLSNFFVSYLW